MICSRCRTSLSTECGDTFQRSPLERNAVCEKNRRTHTGKHTCTGPESRQHSRARWNSDQQGHTQAERPEHDEDNHFHVAQKHGETEEVPDALQSVSEEP